MKEHFWVFKFIKLVYRTDKKYFLLLIVSALTRSLIITLQVLMPTVIAWMCSKFNSNKLVFAILVSLLTVIVLQTIDALLSLKINTANESVTNSINLNFSEQFMNIDFGKNEDPHVLDLKNQVLFAIKNQNIVLKTVVAFSNLLINFVFLLITICLASTWNYFLFIVPSFVVLLNGFLLFISRKRERLAMQKIIPLNREFSYYVNTITNFSYSKDVRLYSIGKILISHLQNYQDRSLKYFHHLLKKQGASEGLMAVNVRTGMLFTGIIVFISFIKYPKRNVGTLASSIFAVNNITNIFLEVITLITNISILNDYLKQYFMFLTLIENDKENKPYKQIKCIDKIEMKNVYFKYTNNEEYTLKNINVVFEKGKTYSIVGLNGMGKTTLVKLLCGLYIPTEGEILINNKDSSNVLNKVDYFKHIACVFQDFKLFPFSIYENICFKPYINDLNSRSFSNLLKKIGIWNRIQKAPNKMGTYISKSLDAEGINFSGGEKQKLAIARAAYKNCDMVIMDEPTSALDPLAEENIYNNIHNIFFKKDKIVIFVSHKLSSCKFCDVIYVINDGAIVQQGAFSDLVKAKDQLFYRMWQEQASLYDIDNHM